MQLFVMHLLVIVSARRLYYLFSRGSMQRVWRKREPRWRKLICRFRFCNVRDVDGEVDCIAWLKSLTSGTYLERSREVGVEDGFEIDHVVAIEGREDLSGTSSKRFKTRFRDAELLRGRLGGIGGSEGAKEAGRKSIKEKWKESAGI